MCAVSRAKSNGTIPTWSPPKCVATLPISGQPDPIGISDQVPNAASVARTATVAPIGRGRLRSTAWVMLAFSTDSLAGSSAVKSPMWRSRRGDHRWQRSPRVGARRRTQGSRARLRSREPVAHGKPPASSTRMNERLVQPLPSRCRDMGSCNAEAPGAGVGTTPLAPGDHCAFCDRPRRQRDHLRDQVPLRVLLAPPGWECRDGPLPPSTKERRRRQSAQAMSACLREDCAPRALS
jgi:hypothetical protein